MNRISPDEVLTTPAGELAALCLVEAPCCLANCAGRQGHAGCELAYRLCPFFCNLALALQFCRGDVFQLRSGRLRMSFHQPVGKSSAVHSR